MSAASLRTPDDTALPLGREQRQRIFYLKTDLDVPDARLRALKPWGERELFNRLPAVATLVSSRGLPGEVEPLAAGTCHLVHRVVRRDAPNAVVRSTIDGVFVEDRGLATESRVRGWLAPLGLADLVAETFDLGFVREGTPFDYAILAEAPGQVLRDLGDEWLDTEPRYLTHMGETFRRLHAIEARGAGLLDCDADAPGGAPTGVLDAWNDYIFLNLDRHVGCCAQAGLIDATLAQRILGLFVQMRPALSDRPMRLLHGDPGIHNICVDAATRRITCVLDWEDALVGDPLFEVAMVSTFQPERRMPFFMAGYGLAQAGTEERRLIALYFLRIALSKSVHRLRFGLADQPGRPPAHLRIHRGVNDLERLL